jgi:hypothetical protein
MNYQPEPMTLLVTLFDDQEEVEKELKNNTDVFSLV